MAITIANGSGGEPVQPAARCLAEAVGLPQVGVPIAAGLAAGRHDQWVQVLPE
jgi:hypothetical protein